MAPALHPSAPTSLSAAASRATRIETWLFRLKRFIHRRVGKIQPLGDSGAKILMQVLAGVDDCAASENIHADFAILDRGKSAILVLRVQLGADAYFIEHAADRLCHVF